MKTAPTMMILYLFSLGLLSTALGSNVESCSPGWVSYNTETPNTCLWFSDSTVDSLANAKQACTNKDSSLIIIESAEKFQFFKDTVKGLSGVWIGLKRQNSYNYDLFWVTKDGDVRASSLPSQLRYSAWSNHYKHYGYNQPNDYSGLIYKDGTVYRYTNDIKNSLYICEKKASCKTGWFGTACDKECHCYDQECIPDDDYQVTCSNGCDVGWMGKDCSQKKEDAEVRYFCVNSSDQGKYAQVMIDTKGVQYDKIQPVQEDGGWASWCNSTVININRNLSSVTIKIYVDNSTDDDIQNSRCAGKAASADHYEWQIKIQEREGLVSRNDQEVHIECNFEEGDKFILSGDTEIKHERWFRRSDIKKPLEYLEEKQEEVSLEVVDPSTGKPVSDTLIGSPVALKITFDMEEDNVATGLHPYNCRAKSPDGKHEALFLDDEGCPVDGMPISAFHMNGTKTLITKSFPLFGFDGNEKVEFHCFYTLCFEDQPCQAGCTHNSDSGSQATRHRRSTGDEALRMMRSVGLVRP